MKSREKEGDQSAKRSTEGRRRRFKPDKRELHGEGKKPFCLKGGKGVETTQEAREMEVRLHRAVRIG